MARVKKLQTGGSPAQTPTKQLRKINAEGYGDIELDDDFLRDMSEQMGRYTGEGKNQLGWAHDFYSKGGLSSINAAGEGMGAANESLSNTKAGRNRYIWGNNQDYDKQHAAAAYRKMVQDYARRKFEKKPETEQKDYTFNLEDRVYKKAGGDKNFWNQISHQNRTGFVRNALEEAADEYLQGGEWNDKTHTGNKDFYNKLRGVNKQEMLSAWDQMVKNSLANDGKLDANEITGFVQKYGINPNSLFGESAKTPEQEEADAKTQQEANEKKSENERKAAEELANSRAQKINAFISSHQLPGSTLEYTGDENADINDLRNYTAYSEGKPFNAYIPDESSWNPQSNPNTAGYWMSGKYYKTGINPYNPQTQSKEHNDYENLRNDLDAKFSNRYATIPGVANSKDLRVKQFGENWANITNQFPQNKLGGYQLLSVGNGKAGSFKLYNPNTNEVLEGTPERDPKTGQTRFIYYNKAGQKFTKWLGNYDSRITPTKDLGERNTSGKSTGMGAFEQAAKVQGTGMPKKENGGTIDFNKVSKLQFGGRVLNITPELIEKNKAERKAENERIADLNEVTGSNYKMNAADKLQLAALGADLGGLIAGWAGPAGTVAGTALGVGSDLTQFASDWKRDGLDWGDAGNLVKNLGFTALGAIPFAGQVGKTAKFVKNLGKVRKLMNAALIGQGAYEGAKAFGSIMDKVDKGESLSLDDMKGIMSALHAVSGATKWGMRTAGTKKLPGGSVSTKQGNIAFTDKTQAENFAKTKDVYSKNKLEAEKIKKADANYANNESFIKANAAANEAKENLFKIASAGNAKFDGNINRLIDAPSNTTTSRSLQLPYKRGEGFRSPISTNKTTIVEGNNYRVAKTPEDVADSNWFTRRSADYMRWNLGTPTGSSPGTGGNSVSIGSKQGPSELIINKTMVKDETPLRNISSRINAAEQGSTKVTEKPVATTKKQLALPEGQKALPSPAIPLPARFTGEVANQPQPQVREIKALPAPKKETVKELPKPKKEVRRLKESEDSENITPKKETSKKDLKKAVKGKDVKQRRSDSHDSEKSKQKAKDRKGLNKFRKNNPDFKKEGGVLKLANGGIPWLPTTSETTDPNPFSLKKYLPKVETNPSFAEQMGPYRPNSQKLPFKTISSVSPSPSITNNNLVKHGSVNTVSGDLFGDASKRFKELPLHSLLKYKNNSDMNRKLLKLYDSMPGPAQISVPDTNKLRNVGAANAASQLNQIDLNINSARPTYTDSKLNALLQLERNKQGDQMRNQVYQQLGAVNADIDAKNTQLMNQDAAMRADAAYKNASANIDYLRNLKQAKMNYEQAQGKSKEMLLSEMQQLRTANKDRATKLNDSIFQAQLSREYEPKLAELRDLYNNKKITVEEYNRRARAIQDEAQQRGLDYQKENLNDFVYMPGLYKKGGSLTIEEKKELEREKAETKRILERDKAFNKYVRDAVKSHEKMLSLLSKK